MQKRSLAAVFGLTLVTFGIYGIYWQVKTKGEMNARGTQIPTAWLMIVPFVSIWWLWKYSEGVEQVTSNKLGGAVTFLIMWFLGLIGMLIVQDAFNKLADSAVSNGPTMPAPPAPQPPVTTV